MWESYCHLVITDVEGPTLVKKEWECNQFPEFEDWVHLDSCPHKYEVYDLLSWGDWEIEKA